MEKKAVVDIESLARQVRGAKRHLDRLQAGNDAPLPEQMETLARLLEELENGIVGLQRPHAERQERNEEMDAARHKLKREWQHDCTLFEMAQEGYLQTDVHGIIIEANRSAARLLGIAQRYLPGYPLPLCVIKEERRNFRLRLLDLQNEPGATEFSLRVQPPRGEERRVDVTVIPRGNRDGKAQELRWLLQEVTPLNPGAEERERRDLELDARNAVTVAFALHCAHLNERMRADSVRLRQLSQEVVQAQEIERHKLARELHDELGQDLTGLKLTLERCVLQQEGPYADDIELALGIVGNLMANVRTLAQNLRPTMLSEVGLLPTLEWHFARYTNQTRVRVRFEHRGILRRFPPSIEITVYRIVQEALTNVARHAGANEARVSLVCGTGQLRLQVQDEGCGFERDVMQHSNHRGGLVGIQERVGLLSGQFTLDSAPNEGTLLAVELPLPGDLQPSEQGEDAS